MKPLVLILVFTFNIISSFAQLSPLDSLNQALNNTKKPQEVLKILLKKNQYLLNLSPDKLAENNQKIVVVAQKLNKPEVITEAYRYMAEAGLRAHNFERAKKNAERALKIDDSLKHYGDMILDYNQLGRSYYDFDQTKQAITIYKKAVKLFEEHPEGHKIGTIYGNIGAAYNRLNQPNEALKYFLKQAKFVEKIKDPIQKSKVNYNIGYTYMQLEQFKKSESYFKKALQDSVHIQTKDYVYVNYHALGMLYARWHKLNQALIANQKALKYFDATQNKMYQFDLHNNNAGIYLKKGQQQEAIKEAQKALAIASSVGFKLGEDAAKATLAEIYVHFGAYNKAEKILNKLKQDRSIQNYEIKLSLYKSLFAVNKHQKNYGEALTYLEKLKKLNDSILKSQRDSKIAEVETRYQTAKKEKENLKLKAEKAQQQLLLARESKRNTYLSAGFGVTLIGLGIFAFYYRRNKQQKEMIEHLQKDLHHRIKNNLAIIDALIEDIKDEFEDNGIHQKLAELQNRINSINEIHRQLYHNKDVTNLNLKTYLDHIGQSIKASFGQEKVTIENDIPQNLKLDVNTSFPIGLIVNEFLTNSFKYAFDKEQNGVIKMDLKTQGKNYKLILSDNGKGLPKDLDLKKLDSFGLTIMPLLAKQLNGTFEIKNDQGVKVIITFPRA